MENESQKLSDQKMIKTLTQAVGYLAVGWRDAKEGGWGEFPEEVIQELVALENSDINKLLANAVYKSGPKFFAKGSENTADIMESIDPQRAQKLRKRAGIQRIGYHMSGEYGGGNLEAELEGEAEELVKKGLATEEELKERIQRFKELLGKK